jgi:glycine/D-amino acid oxidase-like deaminating enzyme
LKARGNEAEGSSNRTLDLGEPASTGRSAWPLIRDIAADVLVVGAGITGALVADALATSGVMVAIVDRRGPAKGSTTASTALVQYEIDTPLTTLARKIGKADAIRACRRSLLAVEALAVRVAELGVPDVVRRNTLFLSGEELDKAALEREHAARRAAGLATRFLDRKALGDRFGIARQAALLTYGDLVLDPRKTTLALLKAAAAHRARIFAPVEIIDLDANRNGVTAIASNGKRIHCRHLVFATGYELPNQVPRKGHRIVSTWAIATVAQPRRLWPEQCMIWEASNPYLYLRTTPRGHVICGGEDEEFSDERERDALLKSKTPTLRRKLSRLLPALDDTVEFGEIILRGSRRRGHGFPDRFNR